MSPISEVDIDWNTADSNDTALQTTKHQPNHPHIYRLKTGITHEILVSATEGHLRAAVLSNAKDVDWGAVNSTIACRKKDKVSAN